MNETLKCSDVVEQLRKAIRGEVAVSLVGNIGWDETYAGDCEFRVGDWTIVFFNDCDELDYCDRASAPDGRVGDFDEWMDIGHDPIGMLDSSEIAELEALLSSAKRGAEG